MKAHTLLTKAAAGLGTVALALFMGACSHHNSVAQDQQGYGQMRTEQSAQNDATSGTTVATAPAPSNTAASNPGTPAVISGPAQVDNTGRVYTSSAAGGAGNAASVGLNTNVNIVPKNGSTSTMTVSEQAQAPVPTVTTTTVETAPAPVVVETPAPAPIVVETPAAPVVETPAPMTSSTETTTTQETTTTTTKHHKRMRKD